MSLLSQCKRMTEHCSLLLVALLSALLFPVASAANVDASVVQVLAYQEDDLINQGSGVVISADGSILTNNHLLAKADEIVIQTVTGDSASASIDQQDAANDLAVIRTDGLALVPVILSSRVTKSDDLFDINGYWIRQEKKRQVFLFANPNKPRFKAEIASSLSSAKAALTSEATESLMTLSTNVGRGSYGAGVFNRCGHLAGIVRPEINKTRKALWQPHLPITTYAISSNQLATLLPDYGINPQVAKNTCLNANEVKVLENTKKKINKEKKALAAKLKSEKQQKEQALKEAEKEKLLREGEEEKNRELIDIARDKDSTLESLNDTVTQTSNDKTLLKWVIAVIILLIIFLGAIVLLKRKKDLRKAQEAIAAASATFSDCRFEGQDATGSPLAFMVLGRDLMQREKGLLIGRNPDQVQVVIADDTVSRVHASLSVENNHLYLEDLGSTGGTTVNGNIVSGNKVAIINGDQISFGKTQFSVQIS